VAAGAPGPDRSAALARVTKECQASPNKETFALRSALQGIEAESGGAEALSALRDACAASPSPGAR
jgi:hypothetical protein